MNKHFVPLALAALIVILLAGTYAFLYQETLRVKDEAGTLALEIAGKENAQARSATMRSKLAEVEENEALIASHVIAEGDIVSFLEELETAGDAFGAKVYVASVSDPSDDRINLSLSIEGTFTAVMRTLGSIEHGRYATKASSLTIGSSGDVWSATGTFVVATEIASAP